MIRWRSQRTSARYSNHQPLLQENGAGAADPCFRALLCASRSHIKPALGVDPYFLFIKGKFFLRKSSFTEANFREIFENMAGRS